MLFISSVGSRLVSGNFHEPEEPVGVSKHENSPCFSGHSLWDTRFDGINYFADLRMTFRQNFFPQDWFRNKFGVGLD
jgi:hypothetical protein